jgi:4a-hydroxytetrahydrobiopterin dehydratase
MTLLDATARYTLIAAHPEWTIADRSMTRTFEFSDFVEAMGFVTRVALLAEKAFHHPDVDIRWNRVTLSLSTHSAGGLTDQDAALAAAIDSIE